MTSFCLVLIRPSMRKVDVLSKQPMGAMVLAAAWTIKIAESVTIHLQEYIALISPSHVLAQPHHDVALLGTKKIVC